jgi:hypothetical protein
VIVPMTPLDIAVKDTTDSDVGRVSDQPRKWGFIAIDELATIMSLRI